MDLTASANLASNRARLVETVLLDGVVEAARVKQAAAAGQVTWRALVWTTDAPPEGVLVDGASYRGRAGQLHLMPFGAAEMLALDGWGEIRPPLQLPADQRPEAAAALWEVAGHLQTAALALHPG